MSYRIDAGSTNFSIAIKIKELGGDDAKGLTSASPNIKAYWVRAGDWIPTAITLVDLTNITDAYTAGGFKEIDQTNMSGQYRLDLPNAMILSGQNFATVQIQGDGFSSQAYIINLKNLGSNVKELNSVSQSAVNMESAFSSLFTATVDTATFTPTTTQMEVSLSESTPDHFNGRLVTFVGVGSVLNGQQTDITDYEFANGKGKITMTGLTEAPLNGQKMIIH